MGTIVGLLHLDLYIPDAQSLKDKRRVIKSFKDRTRNRHNVSVAEVGHQETHRRGLLAVAMTGNDRAYLEGALRKIVLAAESHREMNLVEADIDWL